MTMQKLLKRNRFGTLVPLFLSAAIASLAGCGPTPTSSFEAPSPTGGIIASTKTFSNGGRRAGKINTAYVYLQRKGRDEKMPVLILSGGSPEAAGPSLHWMSPRMLEITRSSQQTVTFQAIQYEDVYVVVEADGKTSLPRQ